MALFFLDVKLLWKKITAQIGLVVLLMRRTLTLLKYQPVVSGA